MKAHLLLPALLCLLFSPAYAEEACQLSGPEDYRPQQFKTLSKEIDPDRGAYGVPFNTGEKEIIAVLGTPSGIYRISELRTVLFYGKSHAFVLKNGKFKELYVSDHVLDWRLVNVMEAHPFFDDGRWELKPGIKQQMSFQQVREKLGNELGDPNYQVKYTSNRASIELQFYGTSSPDRKKSDYRLNGFVIRSY